MTEKAVVVFSGGQDSTTCLYWALNKGYEVTTVAFDYGQRHKREIRSAITISALAGVDLDITPIGDRTLMGTSPLVSDNRLEQYTGHHVLPDGIEKTFVPMRNQLFLTIAANRAYVIGARKLVTGVGAEDYGGYPDCRPGFINLLEHTINTGTFTGEEGTVDPLSILTPLMYKTKKDTVLQALHYPGCYGALAYSHTAYDGAYPPTGSDHATLLRAKGFEEADVPDPIWLRAMIEGRVSQLPRTPNYGGDLRRWIDQVETAMQQAEDLFMGQPPAGH